MAFDPQRHLARLLPAEQEALFNYQLEHMVAAGDEEIELINYADIYDEAQEIADKGNQFSGLSTGFPQSVDRMTMGLVGGDIIIIYGYTSMGKSQLAQNIALNVVKTGVPVLFIGLELTNKQNGGRFIRMGGRDRSLPFIFPAKPDVKYTDIQRCIEKAKADGCGLVVVDQLQDLIHSISNEQGEIGQILAELKRAAVTHDVPVIVMSHVNRVGAQPGPPPLEVLKGSSSIEQKADICISVYQDKQAEYGMEGYRKMQVRLTKNRQKGMDFQNATLDIGEGMKLTEEISLDNIEAAFPGAQLVFG